MNGADPKIKLHVEIQLFRFFPPQKRQNKVHKYQDSNLSLCLVCTITQQRILLKSRLCHICFCQQANECILACVKKNKRKEYTRQAKHFLPLTRGNHRRTELKVATESLARMCHIREAWKVRPGQRWREPSMLSHSRPFSGNREQGKFSQKFWCVFILKGNQFCQVNTTVRQQQIFFSLKKKKIKIIFYYYGKYFVQKCIYIEYLTREWSKRP